MPEADTKADGRPAAAQSSDLELKLDIRWQLGAGYPRPVPELLFNLLWLVESEGTLSAAARQCGVSYRSAWNLMNEWSDLLGNALIESRRGRGAVLSPLGKKILWANYYAREQSRVVLNSTEERIRQEIGSLVGRAAGSALRIRASHCLSHEILTRLLRDAFRGGVELQHGGSARCLAHLVDGSCDAAGFHVAEGELGAAFIARYRQHFDPADCRLILGAKRRQGLIMKRGNPLGIRGIEDLARDDIRFVNRQANSGTRILLDLLLAERGMDSASIRGFDNIEFTHSAVSALVAGDTVDVSIGNEAAAVAFDLDFIPLATEAYYYAVRKPSWEQPGVRALRRLLAGKAWKAEASKLDGLDVNEAGSTEEALVLFG